MLLLGLFELAVKNVSENCGSINFCFKASTFKNLRLYLLPVFVPALSPRFFPGNPLTHHSHANPRRALVLWSWENRWCCSPGCERSCYFFPLFLGGRLMQWPAPDHWQQCFRPVQQLAFQEGSRGEQLHLTVLLAEQPHLFRLGVRKKFFTMNGESPAQVSQKGGRCPIPGNVQGQAGWGSEQRDLGGDVPAHCRVGVGLGVL